MLKEITQEVGELRAAIFCKELPTELRISALDHLCELVLLCSTKYQGMTSGLKINEQLGKDWEDVYRCQEEHAAQLAQDIADGVFDNWDEDCTDIEDVPTEKKGGEE